MARIGRVWVVVVMVVVLTQPLRRVLVSVVVGEVGVGVVVLPVMIHLIGAGGLALDLGRDDDGHGERRDEPGCCTPKHQP